ncbi:unnamed protein product, partial [Adineta ricciae]
DMFNLHGLPSFDGNIDMNSMESIVPIATPNNFELYNSDLYDTMAHSMLSPYENYKNGLLNINNNNTNTGMRTASSVSSVNNDLLIEHHRHQEYPTIPPKITAAIPNLGLNLRTTPPVDTMPVNASEVGDEVIPNETTDTATMELMADKDDNVSIPPNNNEEMESPHISTAGRIFYDPNPQIIQRKGSNSVTYKQNIIVRFLQPPPIPNAGPLIIKEVSGPQQPPLPPLVIKQRPPPPKTPPPIIIREKPPPLPSTLSTKVITRHLPPEPAPPRAVIIERLPPLPPKPRDIIIERWLPYEIVNQKRKVIVERVRKTSKEYVQPKNVIITYEPVHAKIERHFQKQNVVREDPQSYASRFGEQLCDANSVVKQARAAGVLEDLDPPVSFLKSSTNSVATGTTDYETIMKKADEQEEDPLDENNTQQEHQEVVSTAIDVGQEDDVLVEENVTPFYMNSGKDLIVEDRDEAILRLFLGENLQQTFHRLGFDIPETMMNEHHF